MPKTVSHPGFPRILSSLLLLFPLFPLFPLLTLSGSVWGSAAQASISSTTSINAVSRVAYMTSAPYSADNADSHRVTTPQMVQPRNVNSPPGVGEVLQQTGAGQATKPILLTDGVPDPKQVGVEWFAPTGHTLRGSFLEYWRNNGGLAQFGYPLTEEFADPLGPDGELIVVQYFERNRFEHHPENAGTQYEVLLGVLGRAFRQQDPPSTPLPSPAIYFQQTGHNLSGTFKAYWESHGGLTLHGYPITEEFEEQSPTDGKTYRVQYFERSRFELHPEYAGTPYEVLLGQLGTQLSQKDGYPYGWYPTYGHAADFSWVSGRLLPPKACPGPECVCTFYSQPNNVDLRVTPVGPAYSTAHREGLILHYPQLIVIFGHMAQPGESVPTTICPYPKFIVSQVQRNPADKAWSE